MKPNTKNSKNNAKKATEKKYKEKREFVGGGWDNSGEYGTFVNLQLNKEKLMELEEDKYGNIRVTVAARKEADEKSGQDLMVYVKTE